MLPAVTGDPLYTGAAAVYPWSDELATRFTSVSRYEDSYPLWRKFEEQGEQRIALPRHCCPLGEDRREVGEVTKFHSAFVPRSEEQARVAEESKALLVKGHSFITQAPTGFGKTWLAMDVVAKVGLKTLVVVTKEDVRDQWTDAASKVLGLTRHDIGYIQGDQCEVEDRKLVIGMIQSLSINGRYVPETFRGIGLTIWDEVHRAAADQFSNSCWLLPSKRRWGLSATPNRQDGKEDLLRANIGPIRVRTEQMAMVPNVYRVRTTTQFPKMKINPKQLGHVERMLAHDLRRNHFIAQFCKSAYKQKRKTIVFATTKKHLESLADAMKKIGIPKRVMAYYVGGLSKAERERAKTAPIMLATYAFTSEATDIPWLDTMVMASPRSNVIQIVGRVLREYPDKPAPVVLDLVDGLGVYQGFAKRRLSWYQSIGAKIRRLDYG